MLRFVSTFLGALLAGGSIAAGAQAPDFQWVRGGHGHVVTRAAYSPDGLTFATASGDNTAKLWRSSDGQMLHTLLGHTASVQSVDFSTDGSRLVTAGWDNKIRVWSVPGGQLLQTITHSATYFNVARISPDGTLIAAAGGTAGTIRIWNISTGTPVQSLVGHTDWVNDLAFSPDGLRLASASSDDTVRVWNLSSGTQAWSVVAHDFSVVNVDYSPDGQVLASAGGVGQPRTKTWNAQSGAPIRTYVGQTHPANDVKFSPDGARIAGSGGDGQVRIWDTASGVLLLSLPVSTPPTVVAGIDFEPDGVELIAGDNIRRTTIWNTTTGQLVREVTAHPGWVHALDFSPDGASLASAAFVISWLCPVKVYDVASSEQTGDLGMVPYGLTDLRYSSNGRYIAGSTGAGVTYLVDLTDQSPDWTIPVAVPPDFPWFARFSPDDTLLATGGTEGTIQLWSVTSPPQLIDFIDFGQVDPRNADFTPDGQRIVIALGCGFVIWDLQTGNETIMTFPQCQNFSDVKVAPDGLSFYGSHGDGLAGTHTIRQFDLATQQELLTFVGHTDAIHSIDLSSDGSVLISGAADHTIRLWSTADGSILHTYDQECGSYTQVGAEGVPRVVFSPDDRVFAYGRNDGTIAVAFNPEWAGPPEVGLAFCFGDATQCPCGNAGGPGEGCAHSNGVGARIHGFGSAGVAADDLTIDATQLLPGQPVLLFGADNAVNGGLGLPFGDGLRCAGANVHRLGVRTPGASGDATWGPGLASQAGYSAGHTARFQIWYRDPLPSPCNQGFNLSHGLEVSFH